MARLSLRLLLTVLAALALFPAGVRAQGGPQGRVRLSMDETDRRIELAGSVVSAADDAQARGELASARELRERARWAAGSGRLHAAASLAGQAREHADRAIALGRGLPTQERMRGQWDRTGEMLERAAPLIRTCRDDRARELLRAALEMQERSRRAGEAGRRLGALQLTMGARARCLRALRVCRVREDDQQAAGRALSRTDEVLAGARAQLESGASGGEVPPRLRDALRRAAALQGDASRQYRDGRYEASQELTLAARRLAHRALGRGRGAR